MSKNVIIAIVVVLVLGVGALLFFQNQNKTGGNPLTSIQNALTGSASMECDYTDEQGRKSKTYIKNESIRSDVTAANANESGSIIVHNKKMYFWNSQGGFMMEIPDVSVTPSETETSNQGLSQKEELMADLEKYKNYCKNAVVSDSVFTPPSDVTFQDYSKMLQQTQTGGSGMTEEQLKQYMEQYSNPQ